MIKIYDEGAFGYPGDEKYTVAAGSSAGKVPLGSIVSKALGAAVVTALATNKPVVGTDFIAGIATSLSTDTVAAAGTVQVMKIVPGMSFLIEPNDTTAWDTQSEYDALVGDRVLLDLSGTTYTILASDGSTYGCVIMPLDIAKYPGKVRFAFRQGCSYLA